MSTTTIARACSPKLILDISNHNIGTNAGHILGMRIRHGNNKVIRANCDRSQFLPFQAGQ